MNIFNMIEVRRYNFIVGTNCIYSGLFSKKGLFGGKDLKIRIARKKRIIAMNYGVPINLIKVSNTLKN